MSRLEDALYERKLIVELKAHPAWAFYEKALALQIHNRMEDIIQPPSNERGGSYKEFVSGEIGGLRLAKDAMLERLLDALNDEITELETENEDARGKQGNGSETGSDSGAGTDPNPFGFGLGNI